jgi:hypothetical protein
MCTSLRMHDWRRQDGHCACHRDNIVILSSTLVSVLHARSVIILGRRELPESWSRAAADTAVPTTPSEKQRVYRQENKQLKWKFRLKAQLQKEETKQQFLKFRTEAWFLNSSCVSDSAQDSGAIGTAVLCQIEPTQMWRTSNLKRELTSSSKRNCNQIHPKLPKISYEFLNPINLRKWETWGNQNFVVFKWKIW